MNWPSFRDDIEERYYEGITDRPARRRGRRWPLWIEEKQKPVFVSLRDWIEGAWIEQRRREQEQEERRFRLREEALQRSRKAQPKPSPYLQRLEAQRQAQWRKQLERYARLARPKRKSS
jgi:hypothetical protein